VCFSKKNKKMKYEQNIYWRNKNGKITQQEMEKTMLQTDFKGAFILSVIIVFIKPAEYSDQ